MPQNTPNTPTHTPATGGNTSVGVCLLLCVTACVAPSLHFVGASARQTLVGTTHSQTVLLEAIAHSDLKQGSDLEQGTAPPLTASRFAGSSEVSVPIGVHRLQCNVDQCEIATPSVWAQRWHGSKEALLAIGLGALVGVAGVALSAALPGIGVAISAFMATAIWGGVTKRTGLNWKQSLLLVGFGALAGAGYAAIPVISANAAMSSVFLASGGVVGALVTTGGRMEKMMSTQSVEYRVAEHFASTPLINQQQRLRILTGASGSFSERLESAATRGFHAPLKRLRDALAVEGELEAAAWMRARLGAPQSL